MLWCLCFDLIDDNHLIILIMVVIITSTTPAPLPQMLQR